MAVGLILNLILSFTQRLFFYASFLPKILAPAVLVSLLSFANVKIAHAQIVSQTDADAHANTLKNSPKNVPSLKSRKQEAADLYKESNWLAATGKRDQAIAAYEALDAKYSQDNDETIQTILAKALINKASILGNTNQLSDEVIVLDTVIARFGVMPSSQPSLFAQYVATAFNNKIYALKRSGRYAEAQRTQEQLETRFGKYTEPEIREAVAMGLLNKADIFESLGEFEASIATFSEIITRYGNDNTPAIREEVLFALVYKALLYERLNKTTDKALTYLAINQYFGDDLFSMDRLDEASNSGINTDSHKRKIRVASMREKIASAMLVRFRDQENYEAKIAIVDELASQFGQDKSIKVISHIRTGMNNAGHFSIVRAKEFWMQKPIREQLLKNAVDQLKLAETMQRKIEKNKSDHWYVYGNLGYALFLSGHTAQAKVASKTAVSLGGIAVLQSQRKDANNFRIEPQDSQYEALLNKLWRIDKSH
jgi:tetratricopeptide (TPR) repeat protein